ncbi:MAG: LPS export ABC transporter periplasmic protein LptC [Bdellovibrionales bacterium]|nr:LPS export ABC transporter periplasmic protein LptC [Bdellovibrionales bacterium]
MKISKFTSWAVATALVAGFFVFAFVSFSRETPKNKVSFDAEELQEPLTSLSPEVTSESESTGSVESEFILNDFHRVETKNGQKLWEVKAQKGKYFSESSSAEVEKATLWYFRNKNDVITLEANEAILYLDDNSLKMANAKGDVRVNLNDKLYAKADEATFNKKDNSILAPGVVHIKNDRIHIRGEQLKITLDDQTYYLARDVSTVIQPKK